MKQTSQRRNRPRSHTWGSEARGGTCEVFKETHVLPSSLTMAQGHLRPCFLEGWLRVLTSVPVWPRLTPISQIYCIGTNTTVFLQRPWGLSFPSSPLSFCPSCLEPIPQHSTLALCSARYLLRAETWSCPQMSAVFCSHLLSPAWPPCTDKVLPLLSKHGADSTYCFRS